METIESICTYCGTGCDIVAEVEDNTIQKIYAKKDGLVSEGKLCVKGKYGHDFLYSSNRILKPRIKKSFIEKEREFFPEALKKKLFLLSDYDNDFYECDLDIAVSLAAFKTKQMLEKYGSQAMSLIGGARTSNENAYFFNKFAREFLKTPNIDCCARICHAPSLGGLKRSIGEGAATNPFSSIHKTEFILIIGSNTTEAHPIVAAKVNKAKKRGVKIAVIDVRETAIMRQADFKLVIPHESNLLVMNLLAKEILENNNVNHDFIYKRCENFESYKKELLEDEDLDIELFKYLPNYEELTTTIKAVAREYASKDSSILWGLGVTEHEDGSDAVSAISNLALLTGNIAKENAGLMPLRGQNNVQGACDMGCLPYFDLGYTKPFKEGFKTPDILDEMLVGEVKYLFNMGEDIAHVHSNLNKVNRALSALEFIMVFELFPNEITKFADIIFGVKSQYEKRGIYTNAERRMRLTNPLFKSLVPDDWEIMQMIAQEMGFESSFESSQDVWDEVREKSPQRYAGASYKNFIERGDKGLQWPVPDQDTPILHLEKFKTPSGKGILNYYKWRKRGHIKAMLKKEDRFFLSTGRVLEQYNNAAQTKESEKLWGKHNEDILLVHPDDGFDNEKRYMLFSKYGESRPLKIKITDKVKPRTLFTSFHHSKSHINYLFGDESDSITKTAKFKSVEVRARAV